MLLRPDGDPFLLFDSGSSPERVVIFGTPGCVRVLQNAHVWSSDGTFKAAPRLWVQVYTIHALVSGFLIPCAYALLPNKTTETYATMWNAIRAQVGDEAADADRLLTVDFEQASINAASAAFPRMTFAGCYFHLGQSVYRNLQQHGLQAKYASDPEFKLRVKMLSAIAFLPIEDAVAGFDMLDPLFENDEQDLLGYFERTYVGRRAGAGRRPPLFRIDLWNVHNRMGAGALRTNNAVEAFHNGFSSGVAVGYHPPVWAFVESLHSQQNITDKDLVDIDGGAVKLPDKKQEARNARLWTLVGRYLESIKMTLG